MTQTAEAPPEEGEGTIPLSTGFDRRVMPGWLSRPARVDLIGLAVLLVVVGFLWGRAASMSFWLDEGIAVGVASHPLAAVPHLVLQESAPPLYYLLLHVWESLFGGSNTAVHVLSLLFALATVPAVWWSGRSLFDRRTGWMCALVFAINPYIAYYATETRMYSMVLLLAVLSTATFIHAFVFGRRRYLPWFALSLALLLYTHNWGLLLGLGAAVALVPLFLLSGDRRRLVIDASLGFGAVTVLYAPWVPSILYQIGQNLQPWGRNADLVLVRNNVFQTLGGNEVLVALGLGAGIGLAAMLQGKGWTRQAMAVAVLAIIPVVTLVTGWRGSVWAYRYLAVVVGPMVLLVAVGLARSGRVGLAALGVAALLTAPLTVRGPAYQKSNVQAVAAQVSPQLRPGDLVVLPDFQMVPLVAHYLRPGLRYATTSGLVADPNTVHWRHSMDRLLNDNPANTLPPLIGALPAGAHLLVMCPPVNQGAATGLAQDQAAKSQTTAGPTATTAATTTATTTAPTTNKGTQPKITPLPPDDPFHPLILLRCQQTKDLVAQNVQLLVGQVLKAPNGVRSTPVDATLLTKEPSNAP